MHFGECLKLAKTERSCGVSEVDNSLQKNLEGRIGASRLLQFVSMAPLSDWCTESSQYGQTVWNSLPAALRAPDRSLAGFKHHLKTYLFEH